MRRRILESRRPQVSESPRPHVHECPRPHVPESPRPLSHFSTQPMISIQSLGKKRKKKVSKGTHSSRSIYLGNLLCSFKQRTLPGFSIQKESAPGFQKFGNFIAVAWIFWIRPERRKTTTEWRWYFGNPSQGIWQYFSFSYRRNVFCIINRYHTLILEVSSVTRLN